MTEPLFEIGADGVDIEQIMRDIEARVAEKRRDGCYTDARVGRAERTNLANLKNDEEFLSFYLDCLRDTVFVDINDFDIVERRTRLSGLLVLFKRLIWKLLKFYTYRLWSQQNQVNSLLLSAVESIEEQNRERVGKLEARIAELERARSGPGASSSAGDAPRG
jgi:hypothetical protein